MCGKNYKNIQINPDYTTVPDDDKSNVNYKNNYKKVISKVNNKVMHAYIGNKKTTIIQCLYMVTNKHQALDFALVM